jgi:transposase
VPEPLYWQERTWLAEALSAGRSIESIAGEVERDPSTVAYWARKHGLESAHADRHARRTPLTRDSLAALVADDLTVREIAGRLQRSATTIRYWLRRYDLHTTPAARRGRRLPTQLVGRCKHHGQTRFIRAGGREVCARCRAQAVSDWRRRAKLTLVAEAGGCCALCGYARCVAALQFHHRDPATKRFTVSGRGLARSIDALREEAAKCVLLCANCHVEVELRHARLPVAGPDRG